MLLFAPPFSGGQLTLIIVIAAVFAMLMAANAVLVYALLRRRKKSQLCTAALQHRREELLAELENLRFASFSDDEEVEDADETDELDDADDEDAADEEAEDNIEGDEFSDGEALSFRAEILAVADMSDEMREKFGFVGDEYALKRYFVRANYSFEARLRASAYKVKRRYADLSDVIRSFGKINVKRSFRQERVYVGRKTLALIMMRGKTLCVALALDPSKYADTKYRGRDMSDKKRFANTPMLIRITSERKLSYAKYLIAELAEESGLTQGEVVKGKYDLASRSRNRLFAENNLKLTVLGEADELDRLIEEDVDSDDEVAATDAQSFRAGILAIGDMSDEMLRKFDLVGYEFENKRYYVRYNYSFEGKLRMSDEFVKSRYVSFMDEVGWYKKLTVRKGFRQQRVCLGRKTIALLLFKGKTLCVALALDPKEFETTKYKGIDVSDKKRFAQTPMLLKLTSARRLGYAKYLLNRIAENRMIEMNDVQVKEHHNLEPMTFAQLFAENLLKITILGEVPDETERK